MNQGDLFQPPRTWSDEEYEALRAKNRKRRTAPPRGHGWTPGTGPAGETCGGCLHLVRKVMSGTYLKCAKARAKWTGGRGSDVRARDAACKLWARREGAVEEV